MTDTDPASVPDPTDAYRALVESRSAYREVLETLTRRALLYICAEAAAMAADVAFIEVEHGDQDYSGYHTAIGFLDAEFNELDDTDELSDELSNSEAFTDLDDSTLPYFRDFIVDRGDSRYLDLAKVREQLAA